MIIFLTKIIVIWVANISTTDEDDIIEIPHNKGYIGIANLETEKEAIKVLIIILPERYAPINLQVFGCEKRIRLKEFHYFGIVEEGFTDRLAMSTESSIDRSKLGEYVKHLCRNNSNVERLISHSVIDTINFISKSSHKKKISGVQYATKTSIPREGTVIERYVTYALVFSRHMKISEVYIENKVDYWKDKGFWIRVAPTSTTNSTSHENFFGFYNDGNGYKKLESFEITADTHRALLNSLLYKESPAGGHIDAGHGGDREAEKRKPSDKVEKVNSTKGNEGEDLKVNENRKENENNGIGNTINKLKNEILIASVVFGSFGTFALLYFLFLRSKSTNKRKSDSFDERIEFIDIVNENNKEI